MSRIGKLPVALPDKVTVEINGGLVKVSGPKGSLEEHILTDFVTASVVNNAVVVERVSENRKSSAVHGLTRTLIRNMVVGVTEGYVKSLEIIGVGYRVALKGDSLDLSLGFSHPVVFKAPEGIKFVVEGTNKIVISGISKYLVGQTAANIRRIKPPEPYLGKGIRYSGEVVKRKAGKTGKK